MKKITVNASKTYDVCIQNGLLARCGDLITANRVAVIYDTNVKIWLDVLCQTLNRAGIEFIAIPVQASEENKNIQTVADILNTLVDAGFSRSDMLLALGGGIVGDITGFAAAIYQRSIRFIQIPTTLLAAIDSSVGGKTGVNLAAAKNQAGAFWQPTAVICDPDTLKTLPQNILNDGYAEAIKAAVIGDEKLFEMLENDCEIGNIIARCIEVKRKLVEEDEFDNNQRQLLNLGHTVGHAIEKCSNYKVSHGSAVAMGMVIITKLAMLIDSKINAEELERLEKLLAKYGHITKPNFNAERLMSAIKNDKKIKNNMLSIVLPVKIGKCRLKQVTLDEFQALLERCLA